MPTLILNYSSMYLVLLNDKVEATTQILNMVAMNSRNLPKDIALLFKIATVSIGSNCNLWQDISRLLNPLGSIEVEPQTNTLKLINVEKLVSLDLYHGIQFSDAFIQRMNAHYLMDYRLG